MDRFETQMKCEKQSSPLISSSAPSVPSITLPLQSITPALGAAGKGRCYGLGWEALPHMECTVSNPACRARG